jgi:hypothetical protein
MTNQESIALTDGASNRAQSSFPDSDICSAALQLAFDVSPAFIANHSVRSYLFARELAAARGLRSDVDYDDELVFLSCILHDLGVTDYGRGDQRFEVDGADAAAHFLRAQGISNERVDTVWQSIALHTSVGLAERFGTEQSISHFGITLDVGGIERDLLSPGLRQTGSRCMAALRSRLRNSRSHRPRHTIQPDEGSPLLASSSRRRADQRNLDYVLRCGEELRLGRPTLEGVSTVADAKVTWQPHRNSG